MRSVTLFDVSKSGVSTAEALKIASVALKHVSDHIESDNSLEGEIRKADDEDCLSPLVSYKQNLNINGVVFTVFVTRRLQEFSSRKRGDVHMGELVWSGGMCGKVEVWYGRNKDLPDGPNIAVVSKKREANLAAETPTEGV